MGSSISTGISSHMDSASNLDRKENWMEEVKSEEDNRCELTNFNNDTNRSMWRKEKKIALQQDVYKLRKRLKHEENVHRALERAFARPLGVLPRLPPYLPSQTLKLLAEVAVLEEEVFKLEEQVLNCRQDLYQEAIYFSSTKRNMENGIDLCNTRFSSQNAKNSEKYKVFSLFSDSDPSIANNSPFHSTRWSLDGSSSNRFTNRKRNPKKIISFFAEDQMGKENPLSMNTTKTINQSFVKKSASCRILDSQTEWVETGKERLVPCIQSISNEMKFKEISGANELSEEILRCLLSILKQISLPKNKTLEKKICLESGSCDTLEEEIFRDPYSICTEFGKRDIGPYKHLHVFDSSSNDTNQISNFSFQSHRLKSLLGVLQSVCISELSHQQKLAFWINIYNSCMINVFLENGIPTKPEMLIPLMSKAKVNVGGHLFSAMTIEHFILRPPYNWKQTSPKQLKSNEMTMWSIFGLNFPEPLVTFALSCGSWSSPAVRVYTASQVEEQLEESKRDYLQAAIAVLKPNRLAVPKLLDWYLLDFAKDIESLMDWICLQLPIELKNDAILCLEMRRRCAIPHPIQVLPYEFRFRLFIDLEDGE